MIGSPRIGDNRPRRLRTALRTIAGLGLPGLRGCVAIAAGPCIHRAWITSFGGHLHSFRPGDKSDSSERTPANARGHPAEARVIIKIPDWLEQAVPGAADAARAIGEDNLSKAQQRRLARLMGIDGDTRAETLAAWQSTIDRAKKRSLPERKLRDAHSQLMAEAFRAVDFPIVGISEVEQARSRLDQLAQDARRLAREINEVGVGEPQLYGMWNLYRIQRPDDVILEALPRSRPSMATAVDRIAEFFQLAAPHYKLEGPVPALERPNRREARRTLVIRRLTDVCEKHFGEALPVVVAALANAALGRTEIDSGTVRGSLPKRQSKLKATI
jgi:hypothetical protein